MSNNTKTQEKHKFTLLSLGQIIDSNDEYYDTRNSEWILVSSHDASFLPTLTGKPWTESLEPMRRENPITEEPLKKSVLKALVKRWREREDKEYRGSERYLAQGNPKAAMKLRASSLAMNSAAVELEEVLTSNV